MELFGLIGVASYCLVSLVVGTRLLRLAGRTGEVPERLIGSGFLFGGTVGYTSLIIASRITPATSLAAIAFGSVGWTGLVAASVCLLFFWRRVYHPDLPAARPVVLLGTLLLLGVLAGQLLWGLSGVDSAARPWYLPGLAAQGGAYALNGWSSVRYWRMLRRRLALGLVEPVVANRIFLWAIASWAITSQYLYSVGVLVLTGETSTTGPGTALVSSLGLVAAASMALAFFSPRGYRRWVEESAASIESRE